MTKSQIRPVLNFVQTDCRQVYSSEMRRWQRYGSVWRSDAL